MAKNYGIKTTGGKKEIEEQIVVDVMTALGNSKPMGFAFTANKSANRLTGNRDKDGSLITEGKPMNFSGTSVEKKVKEIAKAVASKFPAGQEPMKFAKAATQSIVQDLEEVVSNPNPDETAEDIMADKEVTTIIKGNAMKFAGSSATLPDDDDVEYEDIQEFTDDGLAIPISDKKVVDLEDGEKKPMAFAGKKAVYEEEVEEDKPTLSDVTDDKPMNFKAAAGGDDEEEMVTEKQIATPDDKPSAKPDDTHIMPDGEEMPDDEMVEDEGRGLKGYKPPVESIKAGYKEAEGGGYLSIDTESPHWSTEEGYQEAMELFGEKPAWVNRPEDEDEFEDLSIPSMSADIKKLFG